MANGWTTERKARQSKLIRTWVPWKNSTGPKSPEGKARSAMRGYKGGQRQELRELSKVLSELKKECMNFSTL